MLVKHKVAHVGATLCLTRHVHAGCMSTHLGTPAHLRVGVRTDAGDIAHGDLTLVFCGVHALCTMCTVCVHPRKFKLDRAIAHGNQTSVFCRVHGLCTMCTVCVHTR